MNRIVFLSTHYQNHILRFPVGKLQKISLHISWRNSIT